MQSSSDANRNSHVAHFRKKDGTEQCISQHLQGVARLATLFAAKIGLEQAGELVGLLHDLGKYSSAFQTYIRSAAGFINPDEDAYVDAAARKGKIDHSTAGAQYTWKEMRSRTPKDSFVAQMLALCIASHHSGLIDCIAASRGSFGEDIFTRRMCKAGTKTYLDEVLAAAHPEILQRAAELLEANTLPEAFTRLALSVSIANKSNKVPIVQQWGLIVRFLFSCLIDADRIDTANFENVRSSVLRQSGTYASWDLLADRLEAHLSELKPKHPIDELRREISQHCFDSSEIEGGIYTLTVPTGGGKTLASLRFALQHARRRKLDRVLYVIPFTSIIDQNAEAIRKVLEQTPEERGGIVLEHHSNLTPERQSWREKLLSENWDAPVVLTTMVQFLDTMFGAGTRGARRMHQLANSVIVFDEVQTLPVKCVHLFNNAVNFLAEQCNATVILCTATQPLLHRVSQQLGAIRLSTQHEIVPNRQTFFERLKRVEIMDARRPGGWTNEAVAALSLQEVQRKGSCLVIVNTKKSARRIYERARELSAIELVHLSTHMCAAHRKQRLDQVRKRLDAGLPTLCVSTQLIEAGVDVDFGVVIRALAGVDSIAQAAGRCNRNGAPEPGTVHVVNLADENLKSLPEIFQAAKVAARVLDDFRDHPDRYCLDLCGPQALEDYYHYHFFERQKEMSYPISKAELGLDDTLLNLLSANTKAVSDYARKHGDAPPPLLFQQAFSTAADAFKAIDAATEGIVVPFGPEGRELINELCSAFGVETQFKLLKRAQQFTVNVFPQVMQALKAANAVYPVQDDLGVLHLDSRYYSNEYGVVTEQISGMEQLDA